MNIEGTYNPTNITYIIYYIGCFFTIIIIPLTSDPYIFKEISAYIYILYNYDHILLLSNSQIMKNTCLLAIQNKNIKSK